MANHLGVPGYSVQEVALMRANGSSPTLLDVREAYELELANMGDGVAHVPLSDLARRGLEALPAALGDDPKAELIVFCHHGVRSAQVTAWLRANGFANAYNMDGGIDAFARLVDATIGLY